MMKKKKDKPIMWYKKKLDVIFSLYIRYRDKFVCYTCEKQLDLSTSQNGHYISRNYLSLRFSEVNCHCQCCGCNVFKNGNYPEYSARLVADYGVAILEELNHEKNNLVKLSKEWYKEKIEYYEKEVERLKNNF